MPGERSYRRPPPRAPPPPPPPRIPPPEGAGPEERGAADRGAIDGADDLVEPDGLTLVLEPLEGPALCEPEGEALRTAAPPDEPREVRSRKILLWSPLEI
jgi:hypothetical protein